MATGPCALVALRDAVESFRDRRMGKIVLMELTRIGTVVGTAMDANRLNAKLRAAEKREARERARLCARTRELRERPSWIHRIDASIEPAFACAAILMLTWLVHKWL